MNILRNLGDLVTENGDVIIGLVLGAILTLLVNLVTRMVTVTREAHLRIQEKLLEKRIHAYEEVLDFANRLVRSSVLPHPHTKPFDAIKIPLCFMSVEEFSDLLCDFTEMFDCINWMDQDTAISLRIIQEYLDVFTNLFYAAMKPLIVLEVDPEQQERYEEAYEQLGTSFLWECGVILLPDFVGYGGLLEKCVFSFYNRGLRRLRLGNPERRHQWEIRSESRWSIPAAVKRKMLNRRQLFEESEQLLEIRDRYKMKARKLREELTD